MHSKSSNRFKVPTVSFCIGSARVKVFQNFELVAPESRNSIRVQDELFKGIIIVVEMMEYIAKKKIAGTKPRGEIQSN